MKNHFLVSYSGNKRMEVERIYELLDFEGIDYIIEPFCGTSALSFFISTMLPNRFKYILNDIDKDLIDMYNLLKDKEATLNFELKINENFPRLGCA